MLLFLGQQANGLAPAVGVATSGAHERDSQVQLLDNGKGHHVAVTVPVSHSKKKMLQPSSNATLEGKPSGDQVVSMQPLSTLSASQLQLLQEHTMINTDLDLDSLDESGSKAISHRQPMPTPQDVASPRIS